MRILIEEYQYEYEDVYDVLKGLGVLQDVEGKVCLSYVGYYFNDDPDVNDCVFILPKVLLEGEFGKEKVFGHIEPKDLINAEDCKELTTEEHTFIYNLSVWIYRAITVFRDHEFDRVEDGKRQSSIVFYKQAPMMGHTRKRRANTFLDVLLTLQEWNKRNESFVLFIVQNLHSGYNKINWTRTISRSQAVIQESIGSTRRQDVSYLNPINKKRQINFDEELLVIYYSILQHMHDKYGFPVSINVNFPLIRGDKFARYINGYDKRRLTQIKYKYFSDKALELWELCYAFFDRPDNIMLNVDQREYLLVKSFHIVFEAIIDELIAGDQKLPKELKDQPDRVNFEIQRCLRQKRLRRAQKFFQKQLRTAKAEDGHQKPQCQHQNDRRRCVAPQIFQPVRAKILRDQNARADRKADGKRREKCGQGRAGADGGERLLGIEVADDDGVGGVIELLQKVSCHNRQRELHNQLPGRAPGHILCHAMSPVYQKSVTFILSQKIGKVKYSFPLAKPLTL